MQHRHLNHQALTLAAIDDIILRGKLADWKYLRDALRADDSLAAKILKICRNCDQEFGSMRYSFWRSYVEQKLAGVGTAAF